MVAQDGMAEQGFAADALQRPLRSRFRARLKPELAFLRCEERAEACMSLLVLTYPVLSPTDYQWIQTIRVTHDLRSSQVVAPHFTLVFPVATLDAQRFVAHISQHLHDVHPFRFVLRCAP
jgi:hypothetical protein